MKIKGSDLEASREGKDLHKKNTNEKAERQLLGGVERKCRKMSKYTVANKANLMFQLCKRDFWGETFSGSILEKLFSFEIPFFPFRSPLVIRHRSESPLAGYASDLCKEAT